MNQALLNPNVESVTAFFPCYNDQFAISGMVLGVHKALSSAGVDFEVVVVDDGSTDDSRKVLAELQNDVEELRVIEHQHNQGYGGALRSGFAAATKQWVFYTDGDAQYDPSEVVDLIAAARADTDVVQGWKQGRGDPIYRKIVGRAYHHTVKIAFGLEIRDTDCDFRLMRRELLQSLDLRSSTGTICVEMIRRLTEADAKFVEVPVRHFARPFGRSQFFRIPRIARSLFDLARTWVRIVVLGR